jgi:hypothetical protein
MQRRKPALSWKNPGRWKLQLLVKLMIPVLPVYSGQEIR